MNARKHNFSLKYIPYANEWAIYDDGVMHSSGYGSRKDAQEVIDELIGKGENMSKRSLLHFFKNWKNNIRNDV